mmetsp:Transcript_43657/g.104111  ORF Transcript_43657/g.104111 Transcript_43657/m.104111 type:complete len:246 (-) Transcript_43657:686-1423(-)
MKSSTSAQLPSAWSNTDLCKMATSTGPLALTTPESTMGTPSSARRPSCMPGPSTACGSGGGSSSGGFRKSRTCSATSKPYELRSRARSKVSKTTSTCRSPHSHRQSDVFMELRSSKPSSPAFLKCAIALLMFCGSTNDTMATSCSAVLSPSSARYFRTFSRSASSSCCGALGASFATGITVLSPALPSRPSPSQDFMASSSSASQARGRQLPAQPSGTSASTWPRRMRMAQSPGTPGRRMVCLSK